jgi:hypothetical protein
MLSCIGFVQKEIYVEEEVKKRKNKTICIKKIAFKKL